MSNHFSNVGNPTSVFDGTLPEQEDVVNHPKHYKQGVYEVIKVIEAWGFDQDFYLGNVIKYVSRAGKKNPEKEVEDLRKAIWYLERKIARLQGLN